MGTDYYAETYLGFEVEKEDFVRTDTVTTVLCAHEIPKGAKFCPECATPVNGRNKDTTLETWKDSVLPLLDSFEVEWSGVVEYGERIAGYQVISLRTCSDAEGRALILGFRVGRASGQAWGRNGNPVTVLANDLVAKIENLTKLARTLGLGARPVKLYTLCYASI